MSTVSGESNVSLWCWFSKNLWKLRLIRNAQVNEQKEQQQTGNPEHKEYQETPSAHAGLESESEQHEESSTPKYLSHTKINLNAARFTPIYRVGKGVYLKGARSLRGMTRDLTHILFR